MNEVEGIVRRVEGRTAFVEIERKMGCGRCQEPGGCGGDGAREGCRRIYRLQNDVNAAVGDIVIVASEKGAILKAALWAYGMPGALMLAGAWGGEAVNGADGAAALGATAGLILGYLVLNTFRKWRPRKVPRLLSIHLK